MATKFHPFTKPRKDRWKARDKQAPASMQRLTSGAWKRASEVKKVRLPSGM